MTPLVPQGGCAILSEVDTPPWRDRLRVEDELLEQLDERTEQARRRRAQALKDGVLEFGSVYALAKHLDLSETAISNAIKKYTTK